MLKKECDIQKEILDYFNLVGLAVKTGTTGFKIESENGPRFVRSMGGYNSGKGWPDIVFCYRGKSFLCEVKRPGEKLNENQVVMHQALMTKAKVQVYILTSIDDAINLRMDIDDNSF